ncbi:MAG: ABC transporter substrate-binding protein [Acidimicrobiales bacterium]
MKRWIVWVPQRWKTALGVGITLWTIVALVAVSAAAGQRRLDRYRGARVSVGPATGVTTARGQAGDQGAPGSGTTSSTATSAVGGAAAGSPGASGSGTPGTASPAPVSGGPKVYDPGVTDNSILIGGSTFLSGPAAVYGDQLATGLQAAFNVINAAGGVNGRMLKLLLYDDGADPARQLANTKKLVEVNHVFAMSMIYAPGQLGSYIDSVGVPVFTEGQFNEEFTNPWWFATGGPQRLGSIAIAEKAAQLGAKNAAIIYLNAGTGNYTDAYAQTVAGDFASLGIHVAFTESMQPTQSDCTDAMTKAAADGVDFIDFEVDVGHAIPCVLSAQAMNYRPSKGWGGYLIGVPATPQGIGAYSQGMYAVDAFAPVYANPTYLKAVHDVNPSVEAVSSPTAGMYTAGFLLAAGLARLGNDITRQRLRDVLNTFTDWVPPFLDPGNPQQARWTFRPTCHDGLGSFYYLQVKQNPSNSSDYEFYQASPFLPFPVTRPASTDPLFTCRQSEP